jgi:predicted TIM-barrel fold metal-dependent hydrolase
VRIDTHAHVFARGLRLIAERRYTPEGHHPPADYLALLDAHDVAGAVLVQPSFLGTDNGYMLDAVRAAPDRLRAVALVPPEAGVEALEALRAQGVVGVRYNLLDAAALAAWRPEPQLEALEALGMIAQVQPAGPVLAAALPRLLAHPRLRVVVDHFARPGPGDPDGFRALLGGAGSGRVWAKLSAPYRLRGLDAAPLARELLAAFGPERLLWGSDWPWTQFEREVTDYAATLGWLDAWVPDPAARARILGATPAGLFGFDAGETLTRTPAP